MKRFCVSSLLSFALVLSAAPATSPLYINNSPLQPPTLPPQVDARAFLNRSLFSVSTALPYEAQNVQFWTNTSMMDGLPGFRFEYVISDKELKKLKRKH